jgi:hypothetical protein
MMSAYLGSACFWRLGDFINFHNDIFKRPESSLTSAAIARGILSNLMTAAETVEHNIGRNCGD